MINRGATLVIRLAIATTVLLGLTACGGGGGSNFHDGDNSGSGAVFYEDGSSSGPVFYDKGDSGGGGDGGDTAQLTLGFSDSLPEELKQVVIEVDSITFRRTNAADVVVNNFTINELDLVDAPTFQVDLLQYRGISQLLTIEGLELTTGFYNAVSIVILSGGVNESYVQLADDSFRPIELSSGALSLPGIQLDSGIQRFTVEFGLAQALEYRALADEYLLTTNGVRIENNLTTATLSGSIDRTLFDTVSPCNEKTDPQEGNRVYLYQETRSRFDNLADVFTDDSTTTIPNNAIAPFAVASIAQDSLTDIWNYSFGYIPAGSYTIAFACDTAADDSVQYNGLIIPLPIDQIYTITLSEAEQGVCNLTPEGGC